MSRVLIVDDQPHFRQYLRRLLAQAELAIIGEAGSIAEMCSGRCLYTNLDRVNE